MMLKRIKILRHIKKFIVWTVEYTGPLAEIVKVIPVILMAILIMSPMFLYPLMMMWAQTFGEPICYFLYALWWFMFFGSAVCVAIIGYMREKAREKG